MRSRIEKMTKLELMFVNETIHSMDECNGFIASRSTETHGFFPIPMEAQRLTHLARSKSITSKSFFLSNLEKLNTTDLILTKLIHLVQDCKSFDCTQPQCLTAFANLALACCLTVFPRLAPKNPLCSLLSHECTC